MSGKRRWRDEWQQLLAEFDVGTESAAELCRRRSITSSNFYKRRAARNQASSSAFVLTRRAAPPSALSSGQINEVTIRCDTQTPVAWVSGLVTALHG